MWIAFRDTLYKISDRGEVMNPKGKLLKPQIRGSGYYFVNILGKTYQVHRLVAECFIQNNNNLPYINHKDGNKLNNLIDNLEWCDRGCNQKHAYANHLQVPPKRS